MIAVAENLISVKLNQGPPTMQDMIVQHPGNSYIYEQSNFLMCVPACLNMILRRRNLTTYPQAEIACQLGLVVPPELIAEYPGARTSADEKDWGVHPQSDRTTIEGFLRKKGIPLAFKYMGAREIPTDSIIDFLSDNLQQDNDIIVGYNYTEVFKEGKNVGHVNLVKSVNTSIETVELLDPEDTETKTVLLKDLIRGVLDKRDGFWVFAESNRRIISTYI